MDKQSTLAFVMMGVVLVAWIYFNSPEPQPQTANQADTTLVQTKKEQPKKIKKKISEEETKKVVPTAVSNESNSNKLFASSDKKAQIITIETDLVKLELTSKGGKIRKYY